MKERVVDISPQGIKCEIISERYSDVIISGLKDLKYRYGIYSQQQIPFLLFDFKAVHFALPVVAVGLKEDEWEELIAQQAISCLISFGQQGSSLFETSLAMDQEITAKLMHHLSEQRSQYADVEAVGRVINRLKGMVSAEYMIRNTDMDTPWPYKTLCRKLVPARYWFTRKGSPKTGVFSLPGKTIM